MNKSTLKGIGIYSYITLVLIGIMAANSTLTILIAAGLLFVPMHKMCCGMTEKEIQDALGITWLRNKFGKNDIIKILTDINE